MYKIRGNTVSDSNSCFVFLFFIYVFHVHFYLNQWNQSLHMDDQYLFYNKTEIYCYIRIKMNYPFLWQTPPPPRSLVNEFVALIIGIYFSPVTVSPHPIRFSISPWMTPYNVPNWLCNYTYSHTMCNFYSRTRISLCYCLISSYFPMNDSPLRTDFFHAERKNSILIGSQLVLFIHSMYDWKEKSCELCVLKIQSWG